MAKRARVNVSNSSGARGVSGAVVRRHLCKPNSWIWSIYTCAYRNYR